mmetsp:Transcript_29750/g.66776  ORF Transcript_29750/g.66776 Transcript_29750/m.66776 type:complete len:86 (+) Transcript_29750:22-279(+)
MTERKIKTTPTNKDPIQANLFPFTYNPPSSSNVSTSIAAPRRISVANGSRSNRSQQDQTWPRLAPRGCNDEGSAEEGSPLPGPPT